MSLNRAVIIIFILSCCFSGCKGKDKNGLYSEGLDYRNAGNSQGAIVFFKNALEKDPNFFEARLAMAQSYMDLERFKIAENEFQKVLLQVPGNLDALIGVCEIYLQTGRGAESIDRLNEALMSHAEDLRLLNLLGQSYVQQKRLTEAEQVFVDALKIDPENEQISLNLARLRIVQNNHSEARNILTAALKVKPANVAARILLARLLVLGGDEEGALTQYLEVLRYEPKNDRALYIAGLLALDQNDLSRAEALLRNMRQNFSSRPATVRFEGLLHFRHGDYANAIIFLQRSLKHQNNLISLYFLGLSQYQLGLYEQAISQFQKGLDLDPGHAALRVCLAQTLLKTGRTDDCIAEVQKALRYNPDSALAHSVLGSAYLEQGGFDKAMEMLDRAAELDPDLVDVPLKKGIFNLKNGDPLTGESELEKAVNLAPDLVNFRLILASHYLQQQNYTDAIQLLGDSLRGRVEDALVYNYMAVAYLAQNNASRAIEYLKKSIHLAPEYLTPYLNLASYFLKEGAYDKSLGVYREALPHHSTNIHLLLALASVLELRGDEAQALQLFRQAAATGDVDGIAGLVRYFLLKKDPAGALKTLEGSGAISDSHPLLLELKVTTQMSLGQDKAAFNTLLHWARTEPASGAPALATYYLENGEHQAAIGLAQKLIESKSDSTLGYLLQAKILMQTGKAADAYRAIAEGLERDPQSLQLKFVQAMLYQKEGKAAKAEQLLSQLITDHPNFFPAIFALGTQKDQSGDKSTARQLYERVLKVKRQYIPALNNLAYLLAENYGDSKEALDLAIKAYRQMPASPEIMDTLGYVLTKNHRFEEAILLLEKVCAALPEHATVQLHLAMAYQGAGNPEKARTLLENVLIAGTRKEILEAQNILEISSN